MHITAMLRVVSDKCITIEHHRSGLRVGENAAGSASCYRFRVTDMTRFYSITTTKQKPPLHLQWGFLRCEYQLRRRSMMNITAIKSSRMGNTNTWGR